LFQTEANNIIRVCFEDMHGSQNAMPYQQDNDNAS
jgi:hypothetical protein